MINVLLVDDHALVRAGLAALLDGADHIQVVAQAANGREAVDMAAELMPDVALMDVSMPVLDGVAATRQLRAVCPDTSVVMLTSHADRRRVREAMDAGAVGYLLKDCDPHDIIAAVRSASNGIHRIDPRVAGYLQPKAQTVPGARPAAAKAGRWRSLWAGLRTPPGYPASDP